MTWEKKVLNIFRSNPLKMLEQQHARLSQKAFEAQRNGNIRLYSELTAEADAVMKEITLLKKSKP